MNQFVVDGSAAGSCDTRVFRPGQIQADPYVL